MISVPRDILIADFNVSVHNVFMLP